MDCSMKIGIFHSRAVVSPRKISENCLVGYFVLS